MDPSNHVLKILMNVENRLEAKAIDPENVWAVSLTFMFCFSCHSL